MSVEITQDDDFLTFVFDGKQIEVDLYAAQDELSAIDRKHKDAPTECVSCGHQFILLPGSTDLRCPNCQSENVRPDQRFLDDVSTYVRSLGVSRCSRSAAAQFYNSVVAAVTAVKKNAHSTPESPSGTELTPPAGGPPESELLSIT